MCVVGGGGGYRAGLQLLVDSNAGSDAWGSCLEITIFFS